MPVKPENLARYPKDWKAIRQEVLERAGHKCENCGVHNYWFRHNETGECHASAHLFPPLTVGLTHIVLTIAHKDHVPEHVGEPGNRPNLAAWCQRCHLAYDHEHHMRNAHQTRRSRKASGDLFL